MDSSKLTRRAFGLLAGGGVLAASSCATPGAGAPSATFDVTPYVHPELRPIISRLRQMLGAPLSQETLAAARLRTMSMPPLAAPSFVRRTIAGPRGAPEVQVYVVDPEPNAAALRPAILHIHGGGFVSGSALGSMRTLQELALALGCVFVSVDYRLAPETRYPGSLEDNYAGLKWLYENADALRVDRTRIAVMGESAGGGHAAMLAIAARDRGEVPLIYQALIYPMLDDHTGSTRRAPPYAGVVIWTEADNRFGWTSLLGMPAGSRNVPLGAVPARVEDLRGLPPTFIAVGSIDLFANEDIEFARRLTEAGVPTELIVVPGAVHGFDMIPGTSLVTQFREDLVRALTLGLTAGAWPTRSR